MASERITAKALVFWEAKLIARCVVFFEREALSSSLPYTLYRAGRIGNREKKFLHRKASGRLALSRSLLHRRCRRWQPCRRLDAQAALHVRPAPAVV